MMPLERPAGIATCLAFSSFEADTLMRIHNSYEIAQTRKRESEIHIRLSEAALTRCPRQPDATRPADRVSGM
ncbi:hypothetical protein AWL63_10730 [Sphingomonas panacis]|uniref:Uncharacterized protein n=1 Tax=Sphingomonas panacis TaxID=1560345 RepID=A0A1B3ZAB8_9SPHN|nr:hypothetical protein AWL63_10730 [Sphingomonas panacis]